LHGFSVIFEGRKFKLIENPACAAFPAASGSYNAITGKNKNQAMFEFYLSKTGRKLKRMSFYPPKA